MHDVDFKVLRPKDGSAAIDGRFPCGRSVGVEGKEFRFPKDMSCDSCTLQFEWEIGPDQSIFQCADMAILAAETSEAAADCGAVCQNGGVCSNGVCKCREGFIGEYCDEQGKLLICCISN